MAWSPLLTNLRDVLSTLYPTVNQSIVVVQDAGLNPGLIAFETRAISNWHQILLEADNQGKVNAIIDVALKNYPTNTWLQNAASGDLYSLSGADIEADVTWQAPTDAAQLEKIMGEKSTLLHIRFLEKGMQAARSVGRIVTDTGTGSGFLAQGGLLITNNHVLPSADVARVSKVEFNYQKTVAGLDGKVESYELDPDAGFATSKENDWAAVRVKGDPAATWGMIEIKPRTIAKNDTVNIIQHPGGGPKQIALYHNVVTYADDKIVQYLTDTLPGSSGSPCFNSDWEIVALHHSGGWLLEPGTKDALYRNEGININTILKEIESAGLL